MKKAKAAVPIPYIIALILGIMVVGVLGYWFFVLGGTGGGQATETICRSKEITFCQAWSRCGYADSCYPVGTNEGFDDYAPECAYLGWTVDSDECIRVLGG